MAQAVNLLYQRYRFIAIAVNSSVLFAGLLDWLYTGLGRRSLVEAPEPVRVCLFAVAVLGLIGLELWAVGQMGFTEGAKVQPWPFLARLLLFVGACLVTDLSYSKILFLPLLLYSYLAINKRLSYLLALLGVTVLLGISLSNFRGIGGLLPPPPDFPPPGFPLPDSVPNNRPPRTGKLLDEGMGLLIILFFTLLLASAMSQAIQAQQKLTELFTSLEASHTQLQHYSARVADLAATEERNRLARDIHDSLGHHLAAINIQLEKANAYRNRDPKRAYEAVSHAQRTVQDALKDVRASVSSLRQEGEPFLFEKALDALLQRMRHSELEIVLRQSGDSSRYSKLKLMTLYRVIQEGLTNVHKHAGASWVTIAIAFESTQATLAIADNGTGFDVASWRLKGNEQKTQGLIGLQERLSLVGGTLEIESHAQAMTQSPPVKTPARTVLTIRIPHAQHSTADVTPHLP
ncbi:MAG: sensor histidine kinase [Cyanobacteria bacterium J06597_16]